MSKTLSPSSTNQQSAVYARNSLTVDNATPPGLDSPDQQWVFEPEGNGPAGSGHAGKNEPGLTTASTDLDKMTHTVLTNEISCEAKCSAFTFIHDSLVSPRVSAGWGTDILIDVDVLSPPIVIAQGRAAGASRANRDFTIHGAEQENVAVGEINFDLDVRTTRENSKVDFETTAVGRFCGHQIQATYDSNDNEWIFTGSYVNAQGEEVDLDQNPLKIPGGSAGPVFICRSVLDDEEHIELEAYINHSSPLQIISWQSDDMNSVGINGNLTGTDAEFADRSSGTVEVSLLSIT